MKQRLFSVFLVIYFVAIFIHTLNETGFTSLFFYLGIGLAIFAHAKRNWITIFLLFLHMAIEWFAWGYHFALDIQKNSLMIIHIIMDFIFLSHEIKVHVKKNYWVIMLSIIFSLMSLFTFSRINQVKEERIENQKPKFFEQTYIREHKEKNCEHNHDAENLILHLFALGGVLGCVGSHIYYHLFKEKK